ncbi:2-isopropylmalate synthase [Sphaeroforma arctica JP610]|uniref:2-isopropylmalate synthase n=1 Tax=Sphaeroforma arctica JP610 TaxID=667725 RepID=A0A0L0FHT8_9EUKA|nr:2-isopropylmalate synthase [Sphaeroforma arctica JP610]KNC75568.1 2-isopropylmalate synthase [Sphaeroforma arctica JP610]|eukprot:XP_014149470.1 2-isopropylmalate synthase [Sphaeroforma arctica JP610]
MTTGEKETLVIFDTTLRDGEQSPGVTLTSDDKVQIAKQLSRLGVTVCEAGFPIASDGDFAGVERIAKEVGHLTTGRKSGKPMVICGLARAIKKDIDRCYEAIQHAPLHRIHTFLATSDIHLEHKLRITREQCVAKVHEMVTYAKSKCTDIEFSTEDAGRSDKDFLVKVIGVAIAAGATTINIPDTVGYTTPEEYGALVKYIVTNTPNADKAVFSTHCHNDLGLATANTLSGVVNGARQVEVTINGIGERAGNTALEEVVMAITCRKGSFPVITDIDTPQIMRTSEMVMHLSGMRVQSNKAIVGANAFAHESGIHQDGMLKNAGTYEIISPALVGVQTSLVMGKHSGRAAFKSRLGELGYEELAADVIQAAFERFKTLADTGKSITDSDLHAIMNDQLHQPPITFALQHVQVFTGTTIQPTATATLTGPDGANIVRCSVGTGPVNAIFRAVCDATESDVQLLDYNIQAITEGTDALGRVSVAIKGKEESDRPYHGSGAHHDILVASAEAYVSAINAMLHAKSGPPMKRTVSMAFGAGV